MTPSAPHDLIWAAWSGRDTPKPTHTYGQGANAGEPAGGQVSRTQLHMLSGSAYKP